VVSKSTKLLFLQFAEAFLKDHLAATTKDGSLKNTTKGGKIFL